MNTIDPLIFIPRDSGFFSAFNFLVGSIVNGERLYPYFNRQALLNKNKICKQFCYWTNNNNSWLDFFEPIKYEENDILHLSSELLQLPCSQGENAPKEFRIPEDTKKLLKEDYTRFKQWRINTHNIYSKYIIFKESFISYLNQIFESNFNSYTIGVHYRHPSHHVESGPVFFAQYFHHIDLLITKHPDCKIFVASDTELGIMAFQQRYGNRVKFITSTDRLSLDNILEWAFAMGTGKSDIIGFINNQGYDLHTSRCNYQNNHKIIYDLLVEVLFLSKCNSIISGVSNIPLAISYMNPNIDMVII